MLSPKAIDRLKSIPSEIQIVKFFCDRGHTVSEMNVMPGHKAIIQNAHLDVLIYLSAELREKGRTCEFGVDVKSHRNWYSNLYLETQTRPRDGIRYPSWAFSDYDAGGSAKHNRYLAVVRDDENGVSFMKTAEELIDRNKSEKENEENIVRYFSEHMELFTHTIEMYSFEDINTVLEETGGSDLKNRNDELNEQLDIMQLIIPWTQWDRKYARCEYTWNIDTHSWVFRNYGARALAPIRMHDITDMQLDDGSIVPAAEKEKTVLELISKYTEAQKKGLDYERLRRIMGVGNIHDPAEWGRQKIMLLREIEKLEEERIQKIDLLKKQERLINDD